MLANSVIASTNFGLGYQQDQAVPITRNTTRKNSVTSRPSRYNSDCLIPVVLFPDLVIGRGFLRIRYVIPSDSRSIRREPLDAWFGDPGRSESFGAAALCS